MAYEVGSVLVRIRIFWIYGMSRMGLKGDDRSKLEA